MLISFNNICRNKEIQSVHWSPTFTIYFDPLLRFMNPDAPQSLQLVSYSDSVEVSASDLTLQSEFSYDDQVYTHTFTCVFYNSSTDTLSWLQSLISYLKKPALLTPVIKLSTSSNDSLIQVSSLTSSLTHDPQSQSISLTLSTTSDYPLKQLIPFDPITPVKYIRGVLNPSYISQGGFTVNQEIVVNYSDLTLDTVNAFKYPLPADTVLTDFNAEWSYGSQSPLLSIDLSEFDGQETITSLAYAFKGNSNLQYVTLPSCSSVTTYEECFRDCSDLISVNGVPSYNGVTSFKRCFQNCSSLQEFSFGHWNIQSEPDCSYMFANCSSLTTVDHSKLVTISKMDSMFASCISLETMNLYSKVWYVTSATDTFYGCTHLSDLSLWGMDPQRVSPGQYSSNGFFPLGQDGYHVLTVDFNPSHAHGYNVTKLNNNSLSNYLNVLAHVPATLAGSSNDLTITAAQGSYIDANYPSLLNYVRDQGWLVYYTN